MDVRSRITLATAAEFLPCRIHCDPSSRIRMGDRRRCDGRALLRLTGCRAPHHRVVALRKVGDVLVELRNRAGGGLRLTRHHLRHPEPSEEQKGSTAVAAARAEYQRHTVDNTVPRGGLWSRQVHQRRLPEPVPSTKRAPPRDGERHAAQLLRRRTSVRNFNRPRIGAPGLERG